MNFQEAIEWMEKGGICQFQKYYIGAFCVAPIKAYRIRNGHMETNFDTYSYSCIWSEAKITYEMIKGNNWTIIKKEIKMVDKKFIADYFTKEYHKRDSILDLMINFARDCGILEE